MKSNNIAKNYIYNTGSEIISVIIPLILTPYISRTLGVDNIGIYSYINSIVIIFSSIGRLGINTYGKLKVSQNRDDEEKLSSVICNLIFLRLLMTMIVLIIYEISIWKITKYKIIGILFGIYIISDAFDITWIYQGVEKFKTIAVRQLAIKILNLILIVLLVHTNKDLITYTLVIQMTSLIANLSLWIGVRQYILKITVSYKDIMYYLVPCLIYFVPTIANLVYNTLDKVMLGMISANTYESGCYEQAYKIINFAQTFILMVGNTTLPQLTYLYKSGKTDEYKDIISKSFKVVWFLIIPIAFGIFINADLIVDVILGKSYDGSVDILKILSLVLIFASLNYNIGNQILISAENQKEYNAGVMLSAIINFFMNIILIRFFQAKGAAVGSLIAEISVFVFFLLFASKKISLKVIFCNNIYKYIFSGIIMCLADMLLLKIVENQFAVFQLGVSICFSAMIYFAVLLSLKKRVNLQR